MFEIILHLGVPKDHKFAPNLTDCTISRRNLDRPSHWTGLAKHMLVYVVLMTTNGPNVIAASPAHSTHSVIFCVLPAFCLILLQIDLDLSFRFPGVPTPPTSAKVNVN